MTLPLHFWYAAEVKREEGRVAEHGSWIGQASPNPQDHSFATAAISPATIVTATVAIIAAVAVAAVVTTTTAVVTAAFAMATAAAIIATPTVLKVSDPGHDRGARVRLGTRAPDGPPRIVHVTQERCYRQTCAASVHTTHDACAS